MKSKTCIINFAKGSWYTAGQDRLVDSLEQVGYDGDILKWREEAEIDGCPSHQMAPYAFKPYALQHAVNQGYETVIWADASVWAIRNIQPMIDHIEKHGHMFFFNCWSHVWTSDACMNSFGLIRDQLRKVPHLMGICMGWNMRRPKCQVFLERWLEKANDGVTFPGAWTNANQEVSTDPEVKGHRHDQAAASIIAWGLGMETIVAHETYFQYYENPQKTTFMQNPTFEMIKPGVVMVAQGM